MRALRQGPKQPGRQGQGGRDKSPLTFEQGRPVVLICHYQALLVGGFVQPGTCPPHPPVLGPPALLLPQIQPTSDSVAGERGWQWTSLAGQAPRQAPSWHSGACSSQQPLPGKSSCFRTWCPPRGGWEPTLLPARPHRRISLGKCPAAKGAVSVLRGPCYRWGSPPRGRAPPVPPLQGLIAGKINSNLTVFTISAGAQAS